MTSLGEKTYKIFLFETLHSFIKRCFCLSLSEAEEKRGGKGSTSFPSHKNKPNIHSTFWADPNASAILKAFNTTASVLLQKSGSWLALGSWGWRMMCPKAASGGEKKIIISEQLCDCCTTVVGKAVQQGQVLIHYITGNQDRLCCRRKPLRMWNQLRVQSTICRTGSTTQLISTGTWMPLFKQN